jgi:hypothetical protein
MAKSDYLVDSVKRAAVLLGIEDELGPELTAVVAAAGIDPVLASLGHMWSDGSIRFSHEKRTTFSCKTDAEMQLRFHRGDDVPSVEVRVTWASYGGGSSGSLSQASAVLNHHAEVLRSAAMAEEILNDGCRTLMWESGHRISGELGRVVMKEAADRARAEAERATMVVQAYRAAKKAASA